MYIWKKWKKLVANKKIGFQLFLKFFFIAYLEPLIYNLVLSLLIDLGTWLGLSLLPYFKIPIIIERLF